MLILYPDQSVISLDTNICLDSSNNMDKLICKVVFSKNSDNSHLFIPLFIFKNWFFWPPCMTCGIPVTQPRIEPLAPAVEARGPNH